jgi:uncharacterized membrane protein YGL010W
LGFSVVQGARREAQNGPHLGPRAAGPPFAGGLEKQGAMMTERRDTLDLLANYAAWHRDQRNIVTHTVGVPMIVFGLGVLLARPHFAVAGWDFTAAAFGWAFATLWYLSRRGEIGLRLLTCLSVGAVLALGHGAADSAGWLGWGAGAFAVGWMIQLLGHYYEGKRPAFAEDIANLLVAPMFVTAELVFMTGKKPQLAREIERRAGPTYLRDLAHPA